MERTYEWQGVDELSTSLPLQAPLPHSSKVISQRIMIPSSLNHGNIQILLPLNLSQWSRTKSCQVQVVTRRLLGNCPSPYGLSACERVLFPPSPQAEISKIAWCLGNRGGPITASSCLLCSSSRLVQTVLSGDFLNVTCSCVFGFYRLPFLASLEDSIWPFYYLRKLS